MCLFHLHHHLQSHLQFWLNMQHQPHPVKTDHMYINSTKLISLLQRKQPTEERCNCCEHMKKEVKKKNTWKGKERWFKDTFRVRCRNWPGDPVGLEGAPSQCLEKLTVDLFNRGLSWFSLSVTGWAPSVKWAMLISVEGSGPQRSFCVQLTSFNPPTRCQKVPFSVVWLVITEQRIVEEEEEEGWLEKAVQ